MIIRVIFGPRCDLCGLAFCFLLFRAFAHDTFYREDGDVARGECAAVLS